MNDPYTVLGLDRKASDEDIKKTYRKLARKYHPDLNPNNKEAEKRFKEINEAYSILSDKEKKAQYDQFGFSGFNNAEGGYGDFNFKDFGGFQSSAEFDIGDLFENLFGGARRGGFRSGYEPKGADVYYNINLRFKDAIKGTVANLNLNGENIKVKIPPGIQNGSKLKVRNKGQAGPGGRGDLYLVVNIEENSNFEIKSGKLYTNLEVPLSTALFGGKAKVRTPDGDVVIKIPRGTQCGQMFKIKGKGIGEEPLYAKINVTIPKHIKEDENLKKLLED